MTSNKLKIYTFILLYLMKLQKSAILLKKLCF